MIFWNQSRSAATRHQIRKRFSAFEFGLSLFLVISVVLIQPGYADDAALSVAGGNAKLMDEHGTVSMLEESVIINMSIKDYSVSAEFVFFNEGPSTDVSVGFPQYGWGVISSVGEFISFESFVDGKQVKTTDLLDSESESVNNKRLERKWKVRTVHFPSREIVKTKVNYCAPYGVLSDGSEFLTYEIGTGSSWKGNIGKAVFKLNFPDSTQFCFFPGEPFRNCGTIDTTIFNRRRNEMVWILKNFEPESRGYFRVDLCGSSGRTAWENIERRFVYDNEEVSRGFLEKLSIEQMRIMRNVFYARHGKIFKDKELQDYFSGFGWYTPKTDFSERDLSDVELNNVKKILAYEDSLKE